MNSPITFTIPYPKGKAKAAWNRKWSANSFYSGKNWAQRKRDAESLHLAAKLWLRKANPHVKPVTCPVEIHFYWDDGLDVDNHAIAGKVIVDGLKGVLLPDDNRKWFGRETHEFWDGDCILVEIVPRPDLA